MNFNCLGLVLRVSCFRTTSETDFSSGSFGYLVWMLVLQEPSQKEDFAYTGCMKVDLNL